MTFNELNSVEHFIINQLSGVNLNMDSVSEGKATYNGYWQYRSPETLDRGVNEVLVESELRRAIIRNNLCFFKKFYFTFRRKVKFVFAIKTYFFNH